MGQIADTLRATLRDLAQSDGRLYRGLQQELADPTPVRSGPGELLEGAELASREDLEGSRSRRSGSCARPGGSRV